MIKIRRAVEYLYIFSLLGLAAFLSKLSIGIIVAANTSENPDVSLCDVAVAYLLLSTVPLPLWLSYTFYKSPSKAYQMMIFGGILGMLLFSILFLNVFSDNNPSSMPTIQVYGIAMVVTEWAIIDSGFASG